MTVLCGHLHIVWLVSRRGVLRAICTSISALCVCFVFLCALTAGLRRMPGQHKRTLLAPASSVLLLDSSSAVTSTLDSCSLHSSVHMSAIK